ncbi:MAG: 50S ribosomal protein L13 [Zetaproteobacteria bacterium]|nr:MAG: 50S ribosomal protein L13 [Zetaproteobacteria bacterium]
MRTWVPRAGEERARQWYVVDAADQVLGRLATRVAAILRGKHRPWYTPHADCGDHVVVINAARVHVTGRKERQKRYYRHSGYPGGLKETALAELRRSHPERIIEHAVRGMMPKGPLGRRMMRKLKVYAGADHPHAAQRPVVLDPGGRGAGEGNQG